MHQSNWAESALDYKTCRYGRSRMLYRGPKKKLQDGYISFLGGSETFGKFVATPYPELVEGALDRTCVNLGSLNAGLDAILQDESLISICNRGALTVLPLPSATDLTNRFYAVHPRRNDRFIQASSLMERLFPTLDYVEFNFTRHLLKHAEKKHPDKFPELVKGLQETWVVRMRHLIGRLEGRVVLLWITEAPPKGKSMKSGPLLVTNRMVDAISGKAKAIVQLSLSRESQEMGTEGMHFLGHEATMAENLPGPLVHQEIAEALTPVLPPHL